ncbi:MAG TPA: protein-disulfide reductase DsbD domain-containing protein [Allosphingosinicella sp.]|jgi:DsbC/DsbD-like thiol-disulfide interchange protein/cytochrome c biogenesis protein CcdA
MTRLFLILAALLTPALGQAQLPKAGQKAIASALLPEVSRVVPGQTVTLAIRMRPQPGWHGYWKNPGDAGAGMRIAWDLPPGAKAGEIRYPVPSTLLIAGLMNHVYETEYTLLVDLKVPAAARPGTRLPVRARMDYLACTDEICVPETGVVATQLMAAESAGPPTDPAIFRTARQRLPKSLTGDAAFEIRGGRLRLVMPFLPGEPYSGMHFFPATEGVLQYGAVQTMAADGGRFFIETDAAPKAQAPKAVEGVLKTGPNQGLLVVARPGTVPPLPEPSLAEGPGPGGDETLLLALAGALLGGILLNVMPCVFPILSLKALSLARIGGDEAAARREAVAYSAGAVLVCLALGALLLVLRSAGETVGWAFQLQDPRVILFLLLLVTAITLNLAGLFELPSLGFGGRLAGGGGTRGAFWTGGLAAFIATPCTGPFMGAALGAALILPTLSALAVFGGLGLGLALPFLLLGFVPALRRRLPKPGPWMVKFRRILAIPMLLTGLGLLWVLARQTGGDGVALAFGAALVLALGLAWWGRRGSRLAVVPAVAAALAAILLIPTAVDPAVASAKSGLPSEPFSEARLAELRAKGHPVFVYFTADWCLTCKVNERGALEQDEVARSFQEGGVAVLVGDWTRGDPLIGRFLEKQGRSGVPLYLYYAPGRPPEILPQILTVSRLSGLAG